MWIVRLFGIPILVIEERRRKKKRNVAVVIMRVGEETPRGA